MALSESYYCWHLVISLDRMAVQIFYKFTSACVALAILQVRTKELIPEQLIVRH